jgi:hypothetical protein
MECGPTGDALRGGARRRIMLHFGETLTDYGTMTKVNDRRAMGMGMGGSCGT